MPLLLPPNMHVPVSFSPTGQQQFNMTIKNSLMANNHFSNVMNCMADVFQTEGRLQLTEIQLHKVTLKGLRILFYTILGGSSLSIVIFLLSKITAFYLTTLSNQNSLTANHKVARF